MGYERALNRDVYLYLYSYAFSTMGIKLHSLDRSQGSTVTGTRIFFRVIYKFDTRETTTETIERKEKKTSSRFLLISSSKDNERRILAIKKGNLILD